MSYLGHRNSVITSNGTVVLVYSAGTLGSPSGLVYSTSTDNGSTWSAVTQIDSGTVDGTISVSIDAANNIYVAYTSGTTFASRKLTALSASSWTVGSASTIVTTGGLCAVGVHTNAGSMAVTSNGNLIATYGTCTTGTPQTYTSKVKVSTDGGATWGTGAIFSTVSQNGADVVSDGSAVWALLDNNLYVSPVSTSTFSYAGTITPNGTFSSASMTYVHDKLSIFYADSIDGLSHTFYDIATNTFSNSSVISSSLNDTVGSVTSDSNSVWAIYSQYVAASSYNVVYKRYNGTVWDSSATTITTDNLNNTRSNAPEKILNSGIVPVFWQSGTASPYTVKTSTIAALGTATDSGTQTGALTGSLTGSSGDVIAKCGVWYYNTVNIVAGMTVKVCSSDGVTGGSLEIHANTVTVAGTIDGSGRGMPGGVSITGAGGVGGLGGDTSGSSGGAGQAGTNDISIVGSGTYGGAQGSAGTNASGGAAGGADSLRGTGGTGTTTTVGQVGSAGGYLGSGVNGDSSTSESLTLGSGGGAGGVGGSGAGGGGGGGSVVCVRAGGAGGVGAGGSIGGKGGNGGALVKIYSLGTLTVSGSVNINGIVGSSGGSGNTGNTGISGDSNFTC